MALTEEDIKKMSPEELRQLQKQQCIFCHIISKRVQSKIVYEDDKVTAVLDINPANPGHILLLPKEHFSVMPQMPDELVAHMGMIAKQMSRAMLSALGAEGTTIIGANGLAAGQRASHFIMHVIPRKEGDKVGIMLPPGQITEHQLLDVQRQLAPLVAKAFGKAPVEIEEAPPEKVEKAPVKKEPAAPSKEPPAEPEEQDEAPEPQKKSDKKEPEGKEEPTGQPEGKTNLDDITSLLLGGK